MKTKPNSRGGIIVSSIISILLLGLSAAVILNRQYLYDQWNVWQYKPTAAIANISSEAGLSDTGKFYLYTSDASIDTAQTFNSKCARLEANNAILGCYANRKIYIYDVNNSELNGIEEVTAAHEMLHAAWDRLSDSEKATVGAMLDAEYPKIVTPDLAARMAYYSKNEPGERLNELHSILGTEFPNLSPDLEKYYSKYFTDRQKVTSLHAAYSAVFTSLDTQSKALASELNALVNKINTDVAQYNAAVTALSQEIDALNASASSVDRTSWTEVNAYNAKRAELLARADQLNATRSAIDAETADYKTKLAQYNQLIIHSNELTASIDSTLTPAPSL